LTRFRRPKTEPRLGDRSREEGHPQGVAELFKVEIRTWFPRRLHILETDLVEGSREDKGGGGQGREMGGKYYTLQKLTRISRGRRSLKSRTTKKGTGNAARSWSSAPLEFTSSSGMLKEKSTQGSLRPWLFYPPDPRGVRNSHAKDCKPDTHGDRGKARGWRD